MPHEIVSRRHRNAAKRLRRDQTETERRLWRSLRAGRLEGLRFKRQAPMGRYIVDFVSHEAKVVVELDGGQHGFTARLAHDRIRDEWLKSRGYKVLRFWNQDVSSNFDGVLLTILDASARLTAPLPDPPPQGGREPGGEALP